MGYKRALLLRWSRRDRLTVVVVAVTVAFLVGSGLLLVAASTHTSTIAGEFTTSTTATYYDSYATAEAEAPPDAVVFPIADVTVSAAGTPAASDGSGSRTSGRLLGVPPDAPTAISDASVPWQQAQLPPAPESGVRGPVERSTATTVDGPAGSRVVDVSPHPTNGSLFPDAWYVANASTVEDVGATGAIVLDTAPTGDDPGYVPERGTAVLAALLFFLAGMGQLLDVLSLATVGGAVLVLIVVYNVVRMTVRDRMELIKVVRATGGTPRGVLVLFGCRSGLIVATGVALGYAIGVIVTNAIVNVGVYVGVPISLSPTVTSRFVRLLAPALVGFVAVGVLAGLLAARPATLYPPARLSTVPGVHPTRPNRSETGRLRAALTPQLLDTRALVPTAMTLAVFAVVVILVTSLAGAIGPLANTSGGTVTEAGAPHLLASQVDTGYASALRSQDIQASPESLLMQASDGSPYVARGANYTAFATLSAATIVDGRSPKAADEAVIGRDLATTLGVGVGDTVTLGGSTSPAVTRVRIVGEFTAAGIYDDELIVPLETAYHLTNKPGVVQFVRTSGVAPTGDGRETNGNDSVAVTGVSVETPVTTGQRVPVDVDLRNFADERHTHRLVVTAGNRTREREVTLPPGRSEQVTVGFEFEEPGNRTVGVDSYARSVTVLPRDALALAVVPESGPPGEPMLVAVRTIDDRPVADAIVRVGDGMARTDERGVARIELPPESGEYELTARKDGRQRTTERIRVAEGAGKQFVADVTVTPQTASVLARPTANVTLANPWAEPLTREVTVASPTRTVSRTVTLEPGEVVAVEADVVGDVSADERASPGTYTVRVATAGRTLASTEYTIEGDDRLFGALASSGSYSGGSGVGRAVESIFGNLQVLLTAMVALAALTTIGSTTATFAQAVHARRRAIGVHRATGATARQVLTQVLLDACRLSVPATVVGLAVALAVGLTLEATGALTVFGVRLSATASPPVLLGTALGALVLACTSALLATIPFVTASPTTLLADAGADRDPDSNPDASSFERRRSSPDGYRADD